MSLQLKEASTAPAGASIDPPLRSGSAGSAAAGLPSLWDLRSLIWLMVKRDLLGRYRGSMMGAFWTVINPLGHLLIYTFVFSVVLKVRFGSDASTSNFALYLMAGLLPWQMLSESLLRATTAVTDQPNLVKRVVFPLQILPFVGVLSCLLTEVVSLSLLIGAAALYQGTIHWTVVFLPLIILSQAVFTAGASWLLSSLGVYLQDIRHFISLALSVWMYTTPIIYPASALPKELEFLLWVNPMAGMIEDYRRVLLEGIPPDWSMYCAYTALAAAIWFVGYQFFHKTKKSFADVM